MYFFIKSNNYINFYLYCMILKKRNNYESLSYIICINSMISTSMIRNVIPFETITITIKVKSINHLQFEDQKITTLEFLPYAQLQLKCLLLKKKEKWKSS